MPSENPRITVPDMCQKHQRLLLDQIGIGPEGPWRAHIIVAQIALFQGTAAHAGTCPCADPGGPDDPDWITCEDCGGSGHAN